MEYVEAKVVNGIGEDRRSTRSPEGILADQDLIPRPKDGETVIEFLKRIEGDDSPSLKRFIELNNKKSWKNLLDEIRNNRLMVHGYLQLFLDEPTKDLDRMKSSLLAWEDFFKANQDVNVKNDPKVCLQYLNRAILFHPNQDDLPKFYRFIILNITGFPLKVIASRMRIRTVRESLDQDAIQEIDRLLKKPPGLKDDETFIAELYEMKMKSLKVENQIEEVFLEFLEVTKLTGVQLKEACKAMVKILKERKVSEKEEKVSNDQSKNYSMPKCSSSKFKISYSETKGHYWEATERIPPGEVIHLEEPDYLLCTMGVTRDLRQDYYCRSCCAKTRFPVPCIYCSSHCFCPPCSDSSSYLTHLIGCRYLKLIERMGPKSLMDILFFILHIVADQPLDFFTNEENSKLLWERAQNPEAWKMTKISKHKENNQLEKILFALSQRGTRDIPDITESLNYGMMAILCTTMLKYDGYFPDPVPDNSDVLIELIFWRLFLTVPIKTTSLGGNCNILTGSKGLAFYPTLTLFRHSCNPNIYRTSVDNTAVIYSNETIQKGDEITFAYGFQTFYSANKRERQKKLKEIFNVICNCQACKEDWKKPNTLLPIQQLCNEQTCCKCRSVIEKSWRKCKSCGTVIRHNKRNAKINAILTHYQEAYDELKSNPESATERIKKSMDVAESMFAPWSCVSAAIKAFLKCAVESHYSR